MPEFKADIRILDAVCRGGEPNWQKRAHKPYNIILYYHNRGGISTCFMLGTPEKEVILVQNRRFY